MYSEEKLKKIIVKHKRSFKNEKSTPEEKAAQIFRYFDSIPSASEDEAKLNWAVYTRIRRTY